MIIKFEIYECVYSHENFIRNYNLKTRIKIIRF